MASELAKLTKPSCYKLYLC